MKKIKKGTCKLIRGALRLPLRFLDWRKRRADKASGHLR